MELNSITLLGNSSIGIFGFATDSYAVFPYNTDDATIQDAKETLDVPVVNVSINNSHLNGLFVNGTSKDLLIPHLVSELEYNQLKEQLPDSVNIHIMDGTLTALGNVMVVANGKCLVSPEFSTAEQEHISDILGMEVTSRSILNTNIVGSLLFGTENGLLAHPLVSDNDLDWLEDYFGVRADVVTVNRGTPYPRPGIIGNSKGVLVGSDTTGPELMRIYDVLSEI